MIKRVLRGEIDIENILSIETPKIAKKSDEPEVEKASFTKKEKKDMPKIE